jgi:hypothetical protein
MFESVQLPETKSLHGSMPYRFGASLTFGQMRFLPACLNYIYVNRKKFGAKMTTSEKSGTLELIENKLIKYYMVTENFERFYLTKKPKPEIRSKQKYTNAYYDKNK